MAPEADGPEWSPCRTSGDYRDSGGPGGILFDTMRERRRCPGLPASSIREGRWLCTAALLAVGLLTGATARAVDLWHAAAAAGAASQPRSRWLRVAEDRAAAGRFAAAAAAYVAAIAAGPTPPVVGVQLGDVLMAAGELAAAQASYRSAITAASVGVAPVAGPRELPRLDDVRGRGQDTALACFGLAAALDRTGQGGGCAPDGSRGSGGRSDRRRAGGRDVARRGHPNRAGRGGLLPAGRGPPGQRPPRRRRGRFPRVPGTRAR